MKNNYQSFYNYCLVFGFAASMMLNVWSFSLFNKISIRQDKSLQHTNDNILALHKNREIQQKFSEYNLKRSSEHQQALVVIYDNLLKLIEKEEKNNAAQEGLIMGLTQDFLEAFRAMIDDVEFNTRRLETIEDKLGIR